MAPTEIESSELTRAPPDKSGLHGTPPISTQGIISPVQAQSNTVKTFSEGDCTFYENYAVKIVPTQSSVVKTYPCLLYTSPSPRDS